MFSAVNGNTVLQLVATFLIFSFLTGTKLLLLSIGRSSSAAFACPFVQYRESFWTRW
jgi:hypothetical protein